VAGKRYYPYILEKENGQLHLAAMFVVFGVHFSTLVSERVLVDVKPRMFSPESSSHFST